MGITNKYFSNVSNFEKIVEAIRTADSLPEKIDESILNDLGYTSPADALILRFFKELNFLTADNSPTPLFKKFRTPDQSKEAFSLGILEAYRDLFEEEPTVHLQGEEKLTAIFESKVGDEKSNIIIGYMIKTFQVLVDYAGAENLNAVLEMKYAEVATSDIEKETKEIAAASQFALNNGNGTSVIAEQVNTASFDNGLEVSKISTDIRDMNRAGTLSTETQM